MKSIKNNLYNNFTDIIYTIAWKNIYFFGIWWTNLVKKTQGAQTFDNVSVEYVIADLSPPKSIEFELNFK